MLIFLAFRDVALLWILGDWSSSAPLRLLLLVLVLLLLFLPEEDGLDLLEPTDDQFGSRELNVQVVRCLRDGNAFLTD